MAGGRIEILVGPDTKDFPRKLESGLKSSTGIASKIGRGIALALAAGTAAAGFGLSAIIAKGKEYQANLNELQAVTQATAIDMQRVGRVAKDLGADMSLPATSAADAAAAMVELAKGGLSVDQAMKAAKGTLQLAAAAQIDAAQAAEIQSNALNSFGLAASDAGHVADVLANTANAASGSIVDMANALKFVGPVAKGLSISIDSVSAALGLLANNGIKGEQAGTSLRGILASLASPSKAAAKALAELGVQAFDQQGKFVGLRTITEQLAKAKAKLTEAEFAAAASTAFGNEGFTAANALANEGAKAFDEMATAVSRAGGAQDVAAAKTRGLGGALEGFKSQVETAGIGIFEAIAPPLEKAVRAGADAVSRLTPAVVRGVETAVAAGELFGPRLAAAIQSRGAVIGGAVHDVLAPIARTVPDLLNAGLNTAIDLWNDFTDVLSNVVDAAKPVANGIAAVARAAVEADGPVSAAGAALRIAGDAAKFASGLLVPIGQVVGGLATAFAALPGPIQTAVIALGLLAAVRGPISNLGDTVTSRVTAPFKAMGEEVRLQQALLTGSTSIMSADVGKVGLAMAALESRIPVMQKMRGAFEEGAAGADRFHRSAGLAAAAGVGIKSAASGIVGALGGPWGLAIAGASIGLSLLASKQQEAAQRAAEHERWERTLGSTLDRATGAITRQTREMVAADLAHQGVAKAAERVGVAFNDVVSAALGEEAAYKRVRQAILDKAAAEGLNLSKSEDLEKFVREKGAGSFAILYNAINNTKDALDKESKSTADAAQASGGASVATGKFSDAMAVLRDNTASADDRARALKDALDTLSGGQVDLESAQARLNEQMDRLRALFDANQIASKGFAESLVTADGKFNIATEDGRRFRESLMGVADSAFQVAQRTFDVSGSMDQAKGVIQKARDEVIKTATNMGLTATQAGLLADSMHLIPGDVATLISSPGMTETQVQLDILKGKLAGLPPNTPVRISALTAEAQKALTDMGFQITHLPDGSFEVIPKTANANAELQGFVKKWNGFTITLDARIRGGVGGNIRAQLGLAHGGIVQSYADGGISRMFTPMKAGIPTIVAPNSWRIIGDRIRDDEFYIPDNNDPRSLALGMEWARRRGLKMIQMALGGIVPMQSSRDMLAPRATVNVERLEIRALSDRFSLKQVNEELYFAGVR